MSGKAYYRITSLLKRIGLPYFDVVPDHGIIPSGIKSTSKILLGEYPPDLTPKILITTRKEKFQHPSPNPVAIEDLGDDPTIAKQKLLTLLFPSLREGLFVIGIDPGERTGVAAFMNRQEIESSVLRSIEETVQWASRLLDNAPQDKKIVKIGYGSPRIASQIALRLGNQYNGDLKIELVDERGTSTLNSRREKKETRDQIAAEIIAFRKGREYVRSAYSLPS